MSLPVVFLMIVLKKSAVRRHFNGGEAAFRGKRASGRIAASCTLVGSSRCSRTQRCPELRITSSWTMARPVADCTPTASSTVSIWTRCSAKMLVSSSRMRSDLQRVRLASDGLL